MADIKADIKAMKKSARDLMFKAKRMKREAKKFKKTNMGRKRL